MAVRSCQTQSAAGAPFGGSVPGLPATLSWEGGSDGALVLLDQTRLPREIVFRRCRTAEDVYRAIRELCVRGAPAIGVAAAYGLCLGVQEVRRRPLPEFLAELRACAAYLESARPTAVNLRWALRRVLARGCGPARDSAEAWAAALEEAHAIARQEAEACRRIGEYGARLVPEGGGVLTHCNAGALATVGYGTALAPLYVAHQQGRRFRVYADETRPLLQGSRLTAFELAAAGLEVTVICDSAAASLMRSGEVDLVIVGADRIAANGDTANKIGTYGLAVAAWHHGIPFYVAAPTSTFDLELSSGEAIPIEERDGSELEWGLSAGVVAAGARRQNRAFDVTPGGLIRGIVTEKGLLEPVSVENIREIVGCGACKGV